MKKDDLMTGYEYRTYHGYKKTSADKLKDKRMFETAVRNRLAMEEQVVLESGEVVTVTAAELLVDKKFEHDLTCTQDIDLNKWAKAAGEDVNKQEVTLRGADELFGDIVIKK